MLDVIIEWTVAALIIIGSGFVLLSAIGLVLNEFHHAVVDRRAVIGPIAHDLPGRRAR